MAAYEDITGETWKPYNGTVEQPANSVDQKAATAQMEAFEQDDRGASAPHFCSLATRLEKEKRANGKPRPIKCEGHRPPSERH